VQDTSGQSVNVGIVGASGYTGFELLKILLNHKKVNVSFITSRQYAGRSLSEVFPRFKKTRFENLIFKEFSPEIVQHCEVVFFCLPHTASCKTISETLERFEVKVIDFSADFRFKSKKVYEETYKVNHCNEKLLERSVYGLPELFREKIKRATLVANPGCYPTSIILALYPAVSKKLVDTDFPVIADSKSGVSGAGRKEKLELIYCEVNESFKPYGIPFHRHLPEISEVLGIKLKFVPHLVPMDRGIVSTVYFRTEATEEELRSVYREVYKNEPFVRLRSSPPSTKEVSETNFCDIFVHKDENTGIAVVVSAIDNLVKGASGQAVQNMNLMLGFEETEGLL